MTLFSLEVFSETSLIVLKNWIFILSCNYSMNPLVFFYKVLDLLYGILLVILLFYVLKHFAILLS